MNETSKAIRRRFVEDRTGQFPWWEIFKGNGIDIGCGPDKLQFDDCLGFDKEQGDANILSSYYQPLTFDYLHASQCLEHMQDPYRAFQEWLSCTKVGGHVIVTVPDWCLYEKMTWPSQFNSDHRSSWSLWLKGSYAPIHVHIPTFLQEFRAVCEVRLCRLVDTNYRYDLPPHIDQTWSESDAVEAFIEIVVRRTL